MRYGGVAHGVIVASLWRRQFALRASERFAERVAPVAQTTHPSQAGLARVLNSLVVPPFLRRGILVGHFIEQACTNEV